MKKRFLMIATLAVAVTTHMWADEGTLSSTQTVCQSSSYEYEVNPLTSGASYNWDLSGLGTSGTDYNLTDNESDRHLIQLEWLTSGTGKVMKSREISADGCVGPWKTTTVTVNPKPEVDDMEATLCSSGQGTQSIAEATEDDIFNMDLVTTDNNGVAITKWDLALASALPSGVTMEGVTLPQTGVTEKSVLKNMKFTNTNSANATVVINVTPYAGDCVGDPYTITVTVHPQVSEPTVTFKSL